MRQRFNRLRRAVDGPPTGRGRPTQRSLPALAQFGGWLAVLVLVARHRRRRPPPRRQRRRRGRRCPARRNGRRRGPRDRVRHGARRCSAWSPTEAVTGPLRGAGDTFAYAVPDAEPAPRSTSKWTRGRRPGEVVQEPVERPAHPGGAGAHRLQRPGRHPARRLRARLVRDADLPRPAVAADRRGHLRARRAAEQPVGQARDNEKGSETCPISDPGRQVGVPIRLVERAAYGSRPHLSTLN